MVDKGSEWVTWFFERYLLSLIVRCPSRGEGRFSNTCSANRFQYHGSHTDLPPSCIYIRVSIRLSQVNRNVIYRCVRAFALVHNDHKLLLGSGSPLAWAPLLARLSFRHNISHSILPSPLPPCERKVRSAPTHLHPCLPQKTLPSRAGSTITSPYMMPIEPWTRLKATFSSTTSWSSAALFRGRSSTSLQSAIR